MKIQKTINYIDNKFMRGDYILSPTRLYHLKKHGVTQVIDLRNENKVKKGIEKFV